MVSSAPVRGQAPNQPLHPLAVAHSEWGLWLESYLKVKNGYFPYLVKAVLLLKAGGRLPWMPGAGWGAQGRTVNSARGAQRGAQWDSQQGTRAPLCGCGLWGHGVWLFKGNVRSQASAGQASGRSAGWPQAFEFRVCILPTSLHRHLLLW